MKLIKSDEVIFRPADFFLLRTTHFPIEEFFNIPNEKVAASEHVLSLFQTHELFREAIAIASPSLHQAASCAKTRTKDKKIASSLLKYISRMTSRATPFGLFSFVSFGVWGKVTEAELDLYQVKKQARPDMEWLIKMIDQLYLDVEFLLSVSIKKNALVFESIGQFVLDYSRNREKNKKRVSINSTPLVSYLLKETKDSKKIGSLLEDISIKMPELDKSKIIEVIQELLLNEFLYPTFLPNLLSQNPWKEFLSNLNSLSTGRTFIKLKELDYLISSYNDTPPGEGELLLRDITKQMTKVCAAPSPLQVDCCYPDKINLSSKVAEELQETVNFLFKIPFVTAKNSTLSSYREKFLEKYGVLRLVPLIELLDEQKGLGLPQAYLYPYHQQKNESDPELKRWLTEAWYACLVEGGSEIILTDDVAISHGIKINKELIPFSFDICCEVIADSSESIDRGDFLVAIRPFFSNQGCASFGRFLNLIGEEANKRVASFFDHEEKLDPNAIFVECSYLPAVSRGANLTIHPNLRKSEINLTITNTESSISLNQIFVGIKNSGFFFTFEEGGKELIFTATNVLNVELAPSPIRFLRDACRDKYQMSLLWSEFESMPFIPRIRYKRSILQPATWRITLSLIGVNESDNTESIAIAFSKWADKINLPRYVFLVFADNKILLDRTQNLYLSEVACKLKESKLVILIEKIGMKEWAKSNRGSHPCEIVVPFIKNKTFSAIEEKISSFVPLKNEFRLKPYGTEWICVKFYMPKEHESRFLVSYLSPFLDKMREMHIIKSYYYVRYVEQAGMHIRVRLKIDLGQDCSEFFTWSNSILLKGLIKDYVIATYEREVEKYGGKDCIEEAESFFCADSEAALFLMKGLVAEELPFPEHVVTCISLIDLLKGFGFEVNDQIAFFAHLNAEKKMLDEFRRWWPVIRTALVALFNVGGNEIQNNSEISYLLLAFERRRRAQSIYLEKLKESSKTKTWVRERSMIISSILHMHCIRVMGINTELESQVVAYAYHSLSVFLDSKNKGRLL